jgi:hypothetical protein
MTIVRSKETDWHASAPWYKTGLLPIIEIINHWIKADSLNTNETALVFVCEDGGYDACIDLWKSAIEQGVRFVNPAPFPYSLSSSPAGFVAKSCNIYGPVIVLSQKELIAAELEAIAKNIFLQDVGQFFLVNAMLYNIGGRYKASISLYDTTIITASN